MVSGAAVAVLSSKTSIEAETSAGNTTMSKTKILNQSIPLKEEKLLKL